MIRPYHFRHVAKITRPVITQTNPGDEPETTFVAVIPAMRVRIVSKRSEATLVAGAFRALDFWEVWFQNPGYQTQILQGYRVTIFGFRGHDREFIIDGFYPPNSDADDFHVVCSQEVEREPC